jgi:hypothetical protein
MTVIQIEQRRISGAFRQGVVQLTEIVGSLLALAQPSFGVPWYLLNEHLLRDIGKSPCERDIAKLQARFGISDYL